MPIPIKPILKKVSEYYSIEQIVNSAEQIMSILTSAQYPREAVTGAAEILGNNCSHTIIQNLTRVLGVCAPVPASFRLGVHCLTLVSATNSAILMRSVDAGPFAASIVSSALVLVTKEIRDNPTAAVKAVVTAITLGEL